MKTSTCPYPKQDQSVPTDIHVLLYEDITHKEGLARATISVSLFITQTKTKNQNALTRLVAALPQKRPVPPPTAAKTGMEIPNVKNAGRMPKPPPIVVPTMVPIPPPIWAHVFAVSLAKEAVEVSGPSEELTSTCLLTISDWTRRLPTWLIWLISCKSFFLIRSSTRSASSCISFKHLNTRQLRSRSVLRAPQCAWLSKTNVINTFSETTMKSKNSHRFCTIWQGATTSFNIISTTKRQTINRDMDSMLSKKKAVRWPSAVSQMKASSKFSEVSTWNKHKKRVSTPISSRAMHSSVVTSSIMMLSAMFVCRKWPSLKRHLAINAQ